MFFTQFLVRFMSYPGGLSVLLIVSNVFLIGRLVKSDTITELTSVSLG